MPAALAVRAHWSVSHSVAAKKLMLVTPGVHSLPEKVLKLQQMNRPKRSFCSSCTRALLTRPAAPVAQPAHTRDNRRIIKFLVFIASPLLHQRISPAVLVDCLAVLVGNPYGVRYRHG